MNLVDIVCGDDDRNRLVALRLLAGPVSVFTARSLERTVTFESGETVVFNFAANLCRAVETNVYVR